jgi:hypothetical protein
MIEQHANLMAHFDQARPDLAADPVEREKMSQALLDNLKAFDDLGMAIDHHRRLTVEQVDRLAQERPPYPPPSADPRERCAGPTGWHRPQVEDWNHGDRSSTCTWCGAAIERRFADGVWRTAGLP